MATSMRASTTSMEINPASIEPSVEVITTSIEVNPASMEASVEFVEDSVEVDGCSGSFVFDGSYAYMLAFMCLESGLWFSNFHASYRLLSVEVRAM